MSDELRISTTPDLLRVRASGGGEVIRIDPSGDVFWRGRPIEADEDFRSAMRDLGVTLAAIYGIRAQVSPPADESVQMDASPPFGSKRAAALALYKPPFNFKYGYIRDANFQNVADQDSPANSAVREHIAARVRGWGRIGYMPDAEALQDEVGAVIAEALTAYWLAAMAKGD